MSDYAIDNDSGHYRPPAKSLEAAEEALSRLPRGIPQKLEMEERMSGLVGTYGNIADGNFIITCSDSHFERCDDPGWWRSYLLCAREDAGSVTLQSSDGERAIEVASRGYVALGMPAFHAGDKVLVKKTGKEATIAAVDWHENRESFYYTLDYGHRVSTNWFFDADIEVL